VLRPWPALLLSLLACGSNQVSTPTDAPEPLVDAAVCGNRLVEGDEQCDDGDTDDTDGCVACRFATCGDGFVRRGVEDCDETGATCVRCTTPCAGGVADPATGHCYWIDGATATRANAATTCAAGRGHLAALDAAGEWAVVAPLWTSPFAGAWLGLTRAVDGQNQWRWEPGALLVGAASWNPGEPNDSGGNEDCVEVGGMTGTWNDLACSQTRRALCERPAWTIDPATNRAYRVFFALRTHAEAIGDCAAVGAHLVTITSADEQAFVAALVGRDAWLGGFQGVGEGTWFWSTGERFDYTNWGPNQPDDAGGNEDCAQLVAATDTWNDRDCTARLPAICEVD
jgi:hypothetical protein